MLLQNSSWGKKEFPCTAPLAQTKRGFTLVELLVTLAIMLIIVASSLVQFNTFDSEILLKTLAYDVALSVRQAQSYSLNVLGSAGSFDSPYGVTFTPDTTSYALFLYGGTATRPRFDADASILDTYQLGRRFTITDVCAVIGGVEDCSIARLDVSFKRPEFIGLFYAEGYSEVQNGQIESGTIYIQSSTGGPTGKIEVGYTGYITVTLE